MLKPHSILIILSALLISVTLHAQSDPTVTSYTKLDTLIFYNVSLASGPAIDCDHFDLKVKTVKYFVDCEEVSKDVYMKYKNAYDKLNDCRPCYMRTLDKNDKLVREGPQYTDCPVGTITEYFPDGKVKSIEAYRINSSEKWKGNWERKYCGIKEGTWTYYDESGAVIKTEIYKNDKLIK